MIKYKLDTFKLFTLLQQTSSELLELVSSADSADINVIPFKDSWTGAQLASHIIKSNKAITQSLKMEGKSAERDPGERTGELKKMFLNYAVKFQSPAFILPTRDIYQRDILIADLKKSIDELKDAGNSVDLSEIITLPAFGEITKYELLHFVLYHTQRHNHQLRIIFENIQEKK
ncbi:MAG TPA: DinB family protein [Chitinophagaceae bacterium]|nr:DinB family protein [Chitinophagaceae bacterium]